MKERIIWLDCAKGFAILLVVVGHVLDGPLGQNMFQDSWIRIVYDGINSFHMPLFFILSGIALAISNGELQSKKIVSSGINLLLLYIFWSALSYSAKHIFSANVTKVYEENFFYCLVFKPVDPFWYFLVLAICYFLLYYLKDVKVVYLMVATGIVSCLAPLLQQWTGNLWIFRLAFYYFFFFAGFFGYTHRCFNKRIKDNRYWLLFVLSIAMLIFVSTNNDVLTIPFVKTIYNSIFCFCVVLSFIKLLNKPNAISSCFEKLGRNSIYIYTLHIFISIAFRTIYLKQSWFVLPSSLYVIGNTIITLVISMGISWLCKKTKLLDVFFNPIRTINMLHNN